MSVAERLKLTEKVQRVPSPKLDLFRLRNFMSAEECESVIERIDANRQPSTISDDYNNDRSFRTSETCHFDRGDPLIATIDQRISVLLGLDPELGEPMQGQRYAIGQEFKGHTDYFETNGDAIKTIRKIPGQRTWTAMIYLNEPDAGGATRFKALRKSVQPERGTLLAWNNLKPDGSPNPATLHHGMPVRAGLKYIITKWFCERPWAHPR